MADKQFNEYFDNYLFYKNVREVIKLDINTHHNDEYNKISMLRHMYLCKRLRYMIDLEIIYLITMIIVLFLII